MRIGLVTESLHHISFDDLLPLVAEMGIETLEIGTGNWAGGKHIDLDGMLESQSLRNDYLAKVKDHGLEISGLNCNGNSLAPGEAGKAHDAVARKTMELSAKMGIHRVIMMSGCPGGAPGDTMPNWITSTFVPQFAQALEWQWDEVAIPYWKDLAAFAKNVGVREVCLENHAFAVVYNAETMLRLREAAGDIVGANFDPSHIVWMGGDPLAVIRRLNGAIFNVHAKDTRINHEIAGPNTTLETKPPDRFAERSWNYVTLGHGHDEAWWQSFVVELRVAGYDDVLSIEHEDFVTDSVEGVAKTVEILKRVALRKPPSFALW